MDEATGGTAGGATGQLAGLAGRRVVVLGGTGFLGRHVCAAFAAAGAEVVSVSRKDGAGPRSLALDLTAAGPGQVARLLADLRPVHLVNCAGAVWQPTEQEMQAANVDLVTRLLAALGGLAHRPRLIQLGTVHEYGPGVNEAPILESQVTAPVTGYGRSKLLATRAVLDAVRATGLDAVVLRAANSTGPGLPRGSLLGGIAGQLADSARARGAGGEPVELRLAPLTVLRDFVDIRDVAGAVLAAAAVPGPGLSGEVVNIGRGAAVPVRQLVDRLIVLSGLPVRLVEQRGGAARHDVRWQQLDIGKARRLLGWRPRYPLDESLSDMLAAA